jgi:RNA-splicing ligase RtcB
MASAANYARANRQLLAEAASRVLLATTAYVPDRPLRSLRFPAMVRV